jgi:hypothetical protein
MMLVVALTAAVGFLTSFALLHTGVDSMWVRYLVAVVIAYAAFLFLLWCWLRLRSSDLSAGLDIPSPSTSGGSGPLPKETWEPGGGQFGGGGASGSFEESTEVARFTADTGPSLSSKSSGISDALGGFDLEELAVVLLAITAVVGASLAAVWIVWAAPALLAELMLDAALAAGLYRRLRGVEGSTGCIPRSVEPSGLPSGWPYCSPSRARACKSMRQAQSLLAKLSITTRGPSRCCWLTSGLRQIFGRARLARGPCLLSLKR